MKTILIYSGGLDSTVLLYDMISQGYKVKAMSFQYGQRHVKELEAAQNITTSLGIQHRIIDLTSLIPCFGSSALVDKDMAVPTGNYSEHNLKTTVVPNRNMIFIAIAAAWSISEKYDTVSYAAHSGDHILYPDCTEEFANSLDQTLKLADWHSVSLFRPYVHLKKGDIVKKGSLLGAPLHKTWSCYVGGTNHCGVCGTCLDRRKAFKEASVQDLTLYDS